MLRRLGALSVGDLPVGAASSPYLCMLQIRPLAFFLQELLLGVCFGITAGRRRRHGKTLNKASGGDGKKKGDDGEICLGDLHMQNDTTLPRLSRSSSALHLQQIQIQIYLCSSFSGDVGVLWIFPSWCCLIFSRSRSPLSMFRFDFALVGCFLFCAVLFGSFSVCFIQSIAVSLWLFCPLSLPSPLVQSDSSFAHLGSNFLKPSFAKQLLTAEEFVRLIIISLVLSIGSLIVKGSKSLKPCTITDLLDSRVFTWGLSYFLGFLLTLFGFGWCLFQPFGAVYLSLVCLPFVLV